MTACDFPDTFRVIRCDDAENLPDFLNDCLPDSYRVRFVIPRWPGLLVIAEYWHGGMVDDLTCANHDSSEYLAFDHYTFEQEILGAGDYGRIAPNTRADWCDGAASLHRTLNRNADDGLRPRFVIPQDAPGKDIPGRDTSDKDAPDDAPYRDARYLVISDMAQADDAPFICIPSHLFGGPHGLCKEHPDFEAIVRRAGYHRSD